MKKSLLLIAFLLIAIGLSGQNTFKYQVNAKGGLTVGNVADTSTITKITYSAGNLKFYRGVTELSVNKVSGFTPAGGSLALSGADALTFSTTAATNVTLPTSGTIPNTTDARNIVADSLNNLRNNSVEAIKAIPDTVQHTANFTLALTDLYKDLFCIKATSMAITIPTTASVAIPIGATFNFYGEGAGILVFKAAANVHLHSDKDSVATSRIHQVVGLKKRGNNYWILYGPLTD